ncbi:S8 family serine peptidase [Spirulina subsalsa FACHB-351]|uniref:S8 family serine peptidase n=1 Tax=Spirulina subsalsa FACHB-351 TaxID=234711 RepID=A0ABT3L4F0_9CYAN|nr:S8 family serine peptidase [Spirulina subsalsa]MCW6036379.1 S8 family serine peptidase [Spirulina subsalsa FACHB-351]
MSEVELPDALLSAPFPPKIYAEAVIRSQSGGSLLSSAEAVTQENVRGFYGDRTALETARQRLSELGFEVLEEGAFSLTIAAPVEVYEQSLATQLITFDRPVMTAPGVITTSNFINTPDTKQFGRIDTTKTAALRDVLDGIAINEPLTYLQYKIPSPLPPAVRSDYLQIPEDLLRGLNTQKVHEQGIRGQGVRVVIVDTGWYRHHYFKEQNYQVNVVLGPGADDPEWDENGHGTGVSANLLAIAPDVQLTVIKTNITVRENEPGKNVNCIGGLKRAIALHPDIISCSWGSNLRGDQLSAHDRVLAATVADAVYRGIVVLFAAGNGGWGFPAQHPDVIAVGGVYWHPQDGQGELEASDAASGFVSVVYPQRPVPDICGLVGKSPHGDYILLPVPPGSELDRKYAAIGDGTDAEDGWAAFSGTSAATPQVAGICALLRQVQPNLTPVEIRRILRETTRDIVRGYSNPVSGGYPAQPGVDLATGAGLVDGEKAIAFLQGREQVQTFAGATQDSREFPAFQRPIMRKKTMTDYPKLRANLEEIQWEIDQLIRAKFDQNEIEDVEFKLGLQNFSPRSQVTRLSYSLRKSLEDYLTFKKAESQEKPDPQDATKIIQENAVAAAEALLQLGRYQGTAIKVLTMLVEHGNDTVRKQAISALSKCGAEIYSFDSVSSSSVPYSLQSDIDTFNGVKTVDLYGQTCTLHQLENGNGELACCPDQSVWYRKLPHNWKQI